MHVAHTGHERGKGAHNRNKTGNDNGLAAVFFVERMGFFQIGAAEYFGIGIGKQLGNEILANHEIDRIAQNSGNQQNQHHDMDVHPADGSNSARGKQ